MDIKYKGSVIAASTAADSVIISPKITSVLPVTIDFYPKNEGERGFYIFTFTLSATNVTEKNKFFIRFPDDYGPRLGPYPLIVSS